MNGTQSMDRPPLAGEMPAEPQATTDPRSRAVEVPPSPEWSPGSGGAFDPRRKSPVLAFFLSAMPGLGQIYIGYYVRGFVHAAVIAVTIAIISSGIGYRLEPVFGLFIPFFLLYNMIDAGRRAALYNRAVRGGQSFEMPEDFKMPSLGGSIAGGAVLIAVSVIALSNTVFGYSLEWIEDWWPMAPLLLGAYLIARGVMDRTRDAGARERPDPEV